MKFVKSKLEPVMVTINDTEYPAILNFKALAELEEITGEDFHKTVDAFVNKGVSPIKLLKMMHVALKAGGVDIQLDDLLGIDYDIKLVGHFSEKMTELLVRSLKTDDIIADDDTKSDKKKTKKIPER